MEVVFVDSPYYWDLAIEEDRRIDEILCEYFEQLSDEEYRKLLE